jgi:3',5'-cyclic AMP phosphodiesterase CpdA
MKTRRRIQMLCRGIAAAALLVPLYAAPPQTNAGDLTLPLKSNSVRFAVIGDSGTGGKPQYEVGEQMASYHTRFPFEFVLMLGDNIYGGDSAEDFKRKFERPYGALLEGGVKFYAVLGNHDNPNQRLYKPFNMGGKRYYAFSKGPVDFFAMDSNYMDPEQLGWLGKQLEGSSAKWKICYFHHPLYSDGKMHGPDKDLRALVEPLFVKAGVSAVLSGHEHSYERIQPQGGVNYFILGSSGKLQTRNFRPSQQMVKSFDTDRVFMLVEIAGDELFFQTISRAGNTVDSGVLSRNSKEARGAAAGR